MQFIQLDGPAKAHIALASRLNDELLNNRNVVWIISGGSNIPISIAVMQKIDSTLTSQLTILLSDERFGPSGHPDSNLQQLINQNFMPQKAALIPVLLPGVPFAETLEQYDSAAQAAFAKADAVIAQLGIGSDGHIAGVLPHSPGINSESAVVGYQSEPWQRLSLSLRQLQKVTAAYAYAFGPAKAATLIQLRDTACSLEQQPAQILRVMAESYIYNDQLGDLI